MIVYKHTENVINTRYAVLYNKISKNMEFSICRSGLGKKPGFSSKNQSRGLNWFKPDVMGFIGLTGENTDFLGRLRKTRTTFVVSNGRYTFYQIHFI